MMIFYRGCLRSWLEQDTVCPTCRRSLSQDLASGQGQGAEPAEGGRGQARRRNPRNWLLHFNGASIASWLPTFSLELHQEDTLINDTAALHRGVSSCNYCSLVYAPTLCFKFDMNLCQILASILMELPSLCMYTRFCVRDQD